MRKSEVNQKLADLARRFGDRHTKYNDGTIIASGGATADDGDTLANIRALLLEEQGLTVRRCEKCGSADHSFGPGCPKHSWHPEASS